MLMSLERQTQPSEGFPSDETASKELIAHIWFFPLRNAQICLGRKKKNCDVSCKYSDHTLKHTSFPT